MGEMFILFSLSTPRLCWRWSTPLRLVLEAGTETGGLLLGWMGSGV